MMIQDYCIRKLCFGIYKPRLHENGNTFKTFRAIENYKILKLNIYNN